MTTAIPATVYVYKVTMPPLK